MKRSFSLGLILAIVVVASTGCMSEDIPPAHRGMMFDRTGALALYSGGSGLTGPILGPGTHWTGIYDDLRIVDCSENRAHEKLTSLTRDGVQFGLEAEITYSIDCTDEMVGKALKTLQPDGDTGIISAKTAYVRYVIPAIGEVVREAIAPHPANEINSEREVIIKSIRDDFINSMKVGHRPLVKISALAFTNMDFPDAMDRANTERATQAILREKAIAERERVEAETETARMRTKLREQEGGAEAAKIDAIGAALRRNPEYLQYQMQELMPSIYEKAGVQGNLVITAPNPNILVSPQPTKSGQ